MSALDSFHPVLQNWFSRSVGSPTEIQEASWPLIQRDRHVLATAATGSGKTLAAFYSILDGFAQGSYEIGATRLVYVSPLKALNNDIQRNLLVPIKALAEASDPSASVFCELSVAVRSGDTPPAQRQRMLRRPPEILITTPESLMLMLTTARGRMALATVQVAILDEIHAVMESRRGAQLMACLERLVEMAGEVQRIGLSATVNPPELAAAYLGGFFPDGRPRPVEVVRGRQRRQYDLAVRRPRVLAEQRGAGEDFWKHLSGGIREIIERHRSTLVFANSRRLAERVTLELNRAAGYTLAYSHHGSLSKEVRLEVERRLKQGELKAIVATSSLELGIDIGDLDEVVLIESPRSITSTLQRIGRAGHQVGGITRASLFPTHPRDFVDAAVHLQAARQSEIEPLTPMRAPLDLLAQLLVSMAISETWTCERAFACLTRSWPYAELTREQFELVLEMLAGRFEQVRIRSLRPRIALDRTTGEFSARKGAAFALYAAGGTIPDRGYFQVKHARSGTRLGELDEEFVWEARVGDAFTFGSRPWRIERITDSDVEVVPAPERSGAPPFWRAESQLSDHHFGVLTGAFLSAADRFLDENPNGLQAWLRETGFDESSAQELRAFLERQRQITGAALPHGHHVVVEHLLAGPGGIRTDDIESQFVMHTTWGGKVNRPIAIALRSAWRSRFGWDPELFSNNHCLVALLRDGVRPTDVLNLLDPDHFERNLRASLEQSHLFGARFRESAGRALLLPRRGFDRRTPLWMSRLNARRLMSETAGTEDFPVTLETWRTCLADEFDLPATRQVLDSLRAGKIEVSLCETRSPSPFAADLSFSQISQFMYATDDLRQHARSSLSSDLISQAVASSELRPDLSREVIQFFEARAQRRAPGYEPTDPHEISEWVKERIWIPAGEWFADQEVPPPVETLAVGDRTWLVHPEHRHSSDGAMPSRIETAMQFYGPRSRDEVISLFPPAATEINTTLDSLCVRGRVLSDVRIQGSSEEHFCDVENFEALLRIQRTHRRPDVDPIPLSRLPAFLAGRHGIGRDQGHESASRHFRRLREYVAPVEFLCEVAWRTRSNSHGVARLDADLAANRVGWHGNGIEKIALSYENDPAAAVAPSQTCSLIDAFPDPQARYSYGQIAQNSGLRRDHLNRQFWDAVWAGAISSEGLSPLACASKRGFRLRNGSSMPIETPFRRPGPKPEPGWAGLWRLNTRDVENDPLEQLESQKERARILIERYGIVNREIANREGGVFGWKGIFSALRLMELGGEVVSGQFVEEFSGPQFMIPWEVSELHRSRALRPFWISAWDPVAPTGLGARWQGLPQRRMGSYLGFFDGELAGWATSGGRCLEILMDSEHPEIAGLWNALGAHVTLHSSVRIETINQISTGSSEYFQTLRHALTGYLDQTGYVLERTQL